MGKEFRERDATQTVSSQPYDGTLSTLRDKYERGQVDLKPWRLQTRWPIGIRALKGVLDARILQHGRIAFKSRADNIPARLRTKRAGSSVAGVSARQQW